MTQQTDSKQDIIIVPLSRGQKTIIDKIDLPLVEGRKWQAKLRRDGKCYYACNSEGKNLARLIMGAVDGEIVDHIDGDGLNNRRSNLRKGTQSQNCVNRLYKNTKAFRGVSKNGSRWRARVWQNLKVHDLGNFDTPEEAHQAYLSAAKNIHGEWLPEKSPLILPPSDALQPTQETE